MSQVHKKPSVKKDKTKPNFKSDKSDKKDFYIGFYEVWKLNNIESLDVSFHTVDGGREKIDESKDDRILIVTQGFATNLDTKKVIRDGDIVEIPAGMTFHYRGQLKYYLIASKK